LPDFSVSSFFLSLFLEVCTSASKIDSVEEGDEVVNGVVEKSVDNKSFDESDNFVEVEESANLVDDEVVEESSNVELENSVVGFGVEATVINVDRVSEILE